MLIEWCKFTSNPVIVPIHHLKSPFQLFNFPFISCDLVIIVVFKRSPHAQHFRISVIRNVGSRPKPVDLRFNQDNPNTYVFQELK